MTTAPAIEVQELRRSFGEFIAVDGVSFDVPRGEIFGFLGPNGAGKTTTISMLCTLLRPTGGKAYIGGRDVASESDAVRRQIGLVFQDTTLDERLTASENLTFHGEIYGMTRDDIRERVTEMLIRVGLDDRRDSQVMTFSGGMKRRLEIARGLMHHPTALFLDEPTIGLDPQTRRSLWEYAQSLRDAEGVTIFLTTHYMDEAEACDRIAIIDHGKIIALDTPSGLKARLGGDVVTVSGEDNAVLASEIQDARTRVCHLNPTRPVNSAATTRTPSSVFSGSLASRRDAGPSVTAPPRLGSNCEPWQEQNSIPASFSHMLTGQP